MADKKNPHYVLGIAMEMLDPSLADFPCHQVLYDKNIFSRMLDQNYHLKDERVCWGGEGQAVPTLVGSSRSLKQRKS